MSSYSGQNGLYSCLELVPSDKEVLQRFFFRTRPPMRLGEFLDNGHVTLMNSRSAVHVATLRSFLHECRRKINAQPAFAEYWSGHDNVGYVVLVLLSDSLLHAHELLTKCGAQHTFGAFVPHITLCTNIGPKTNSIEQWVDRINTELCTFETDIGLHNMHFADLRCKWPV